MPGTSLRRTRIEQFTIIVDDYDQAIEFLTAPRTETVISTAKSHG